MVDAKSLPGPYKGALELRKVRRSKPNTAVISPKLQYKKGTRKKTHHTSRPQGHQIQTTVRQEIRGTNISCRTKGEGDFCKSNLCSIPYYSFRAKEGEDRIGTSLSDWRANIKKKRRKLL